MSFFINILIGVVIGTGFIIPGVSGGALAVILGVYDKIFDSLKNIKNKSNFVFLITIFFNHFFFFENVLLNLVK